MAPTQITEDYYTILEISETADLATITSSYKRLALTTHPDKNITNPNATTEFQLLQEAYSTLKDPEKRSAYNIQYVRIKRTRSTNQRATADTAQQQSSSGNDNTEEKERGKKARAALRERKLQVLNTRRTRQADEVFEEKRVLNKVQRELNKLQEDADKEAREQAAEGGWWGYLSSYVTKKPQETEEVKEERERRKLDRRAAQTIREKELERQKTKVKNLETSIFCTDDEIKKIRSVIGQEDKEEEDARRREAQKRWEEKWKAEQERIRRENEIRIAEEWRKRATEAEERRRRQQQADAEAEKERQRKAKERRETEIKRAQNQSATGPSRSSKTSCDHRGWWPQVEGAHLCSQCSTFTTRFAFQCPTCKKVACATCRNVLKGGTSGQFGSRNSRKRNDNFKSRRTRPTFEDDDFNYWDYGD